MISVDIAFTAGAANSAQAITDSVITGDPTITISQVAAIAVTVVRIHVSSWFIAYLNAAIVVPHLIDIKAVT